MLTPRCGFRGHFAQGCRPQDRMSRGRVILADQNSGGAFQPCTVRQIVHGLFSSIFDCLSARGISNKKHPPVRPS